MSKIKNPKTKTWIEVFQSERKTFPQGYCVTRVMRNKNHYNRKPKYGRKEWE